MELPRILYGTAWKEDRTQALVEQALREGFRGIDTANQRKHYHEAGVGAALADALRDGRLAREEVFVQTKFTHRAGQDHRLPYDPSAPVAVQVAQSFESSRAHLGVDHVDSYVLHGPSSYPGLGPADLEAWRAMEALHDDGRAKRLGVSNVTAQQLRELHDAARVKPSIVQNRTLTRPGADAEVRAFCASRGIAYQGFSLLTAAPALLRHPVVVGVAQRLGVTPAAATLRLFAEQGVVVLTGTTSRAHMEEDLRAFAAGVPREDVEAFDALVPRPA